MSVKTTPAVINAKPRYKTIIISDTHLGKKAASAAFLFEFLRETSSDRLILNGDILEGWGMKHKKRKPFPEMHARCMDALNAKAAEGTEVIYIRGNHDEDWAKGKKSLNTRTITFQNKARNIQSPIQFRKSFQHKDAKGRLFFVLHGDAFDGFMKSTKKKIVAQYADRAYEGFVHLNGIFREYVQAATGLHVSPAAYLKRKTKKILGIIGNFEDAVTSKNMVRRYDGVICGHIHHAEITDKKGMLYMNSGDWVESCTALVEDFDGNWSIIDWASQRQALKLGVAPTVFEKNPYLPYREITQRQLTLARLLWPGKNYNELTQELRDYRHKMEKNRQKLVDAFEAKAANDNPKETDFDKILQAGQRIEGRIQKLQDRMRPHP